MYLWRGRARGLARPRILAGALVAFTVCAVALLGATSAAAPAQPASGWLLVGRSESGQVLLSAPLPDGRFALRYRNSVFGSLAEERFRVDAAGRLVLVELAADEVAVLGEYYEVADRPRQASPPDVRAWVAPPSAQVALTELPLVATRHGDRTLVVDGQRPLALWILTGGAGDSLVFTAEQAR